MLSSLLDPDSNINHLAVGHKLWVCSGGNEFLAFGKQVHSLETQWLNWRCINKGRETYTIDEICQDNSCLLLGKKRLEEESQNFKVKGEVIIGGSQSLGDRPISSHTMELLWLMESF